MDQRRGPRLSRLLFVAALTASFTLAMVVGWRLLQGSPQVAAAAAKPTENEVLHCMWSTPAESDHSEALALALIASVLPFLVLGRLMVRRVAKPEMR